MLSLRICGACADIINVSNVCIMCENKVGNFRVRRYNSLAWFQDICVRTCPDKPRAVLCGATRISTVVSIKFYLKHTSNNMQYLVSTVSRCNVTLTI